MKISTYFVSDWMVYIIAAIPWFIGLVCVLWVLSLRFPMNGIFYTQSDLTGKNAFIYPFLPAERTVSPGLQEGGWLGQRILGDPVYMSARIPGPYQTVDVEMEFRAIHQPLIEFGVVRDASGAELDMKPWFSQMLETSSWKRALSPQGVKGYVRTGTPPARLDDRDVRGMALWLATTTSPLMSDPLNDGRKIYNVSLRGTHDFWLVPSGGIVDLLMNIQDTNRTRKGGSVGIVVSHDNKTVFQDAVNTGGSQDKTYGAIIPVSIKLKDLQPGVYRIRLLADDDIFIRSLSTTNIHWVVGPRIYSGDQVGFATSTSVLRVWTSARHIVAETFHKEGLQTITLGATQGKIMRTHTAVRIDRTDGQLEPVLLDAPNGDIRIIADGFFTFDPVAYFEPQPRRLTDQTKGINEGIQAVRTDYAGVDVLDGDWRRAKATFAIPADAETLRFVLSSPGIVSRTGAVDVRRVSLTFRRPPMTIGTWWSVIVGELKRVWRRL